jgi:hypothetical protein
MKTIWRVAKVGFLDFLIVVLAGPVFAETPKETAISSLAIWGENLSEPFGSLLAKEIAKKSHIQTVKHLPSRRFEEAVQLSKNSEVDGLLKVDIGKSIIDLKLFSIPGARSLDHWQIPRSKRATGKSQQAFLLEKITQTFVDDFPYQAIVTKVSGQEIELSVGQNSNVKEGTRFSVFEFGGKNPDFSSRKIETGEILITKTSPNRSWGQVTETSSQILPYNKIDLRETNKARLRKQGDSFWLGSGIKQIFFDGEARTPSLSHRQFRLPLLSMPFLRIGFGPLAAEGTYGTVNYSSINAKLAIAQVSYRIVTFNFLGSEKIRTSSSLGLYWQSFSIQSLNQPEVTSTMKAPQLSQVFEVDVSPNAIFLVDVNLYLPVLSENQYDSSDSSKSYGVGGGGGIKVQLTPSISVYGNVNAKRFSLSLASSDVVENTYGFSGHLAYSF